VSTTTEPAGSSAATTHRSWTGAAVALVSAATFSSAGVFGKPLLDAGWSAGAAIAARILGAFLVLSVPAALALRGRWGALRGNVGLLSTYGVVSIAGTQLCYFHAIDRLPVAVATLVFFLAPVLVIGWLWLRTGQRPTRLTLVGAAVSVAGLVLVLDLFGTVEVDLVGVAWAAAGAVCLVAYYVVGGHPVQGVPPLSMAAAGLALAGVSVLLAGVVGLVPLEASTEDVVLLDRQVPWFLPLLGLALVACALAYVTGIVAARRLGARLASFFGLSEVLFAVLFAWVLLDELPRPIQLAGGLLIVAGVACIRWDELRSGEDEHDPEVTLPSPEGFAEAG
jgi:drug/metabolite transporter (DMT)-like permease